MLLAFFDCNYGSSLSGTQAFSFLEKPLKRYGIAPTYLDFRQSPGTTHVPKAWPVNDIKHAGILLFHGSASRRQAYDFMAGLLNTPDTQSKMDKAIFEMGLPDAPQDGLATTLSYESCLLTRIVLRGSQGPGNHSQEANDEAELIAALPKIREAATWVRERIRIRNSLMLASIYAAAPLAATAF